MSENQAMKATDNQSTEFSLKHTSQQDWNETKGQRGDDMEIMEVLVTDTANAMSIENSTTVNVRILNVGDYHQESLFVRIKQIEDPGIPLRQVGLSHVSSLRTSLRLYSFNYCCSTPSVTFRSKVSDDDVTTPSTVFMIVGRPVRNKESKVLLLDGRHHLKAIRQL